MNTSQLPVYQKLPALLLASTCAIALLSGCATSGHLATPSGRPEITIPRSLFRHAPVAITSFNMSKGRDLDVAKPTEIVTYEGLQTQDGKLQVSSKMVYQFVEKNDSVTILSKKLITQDLDDNDASEATDQPSLDAQQQELQQIATGLSQRVAEEAQDQNSNNVGSGDHSQ